MQKTLYTENALAVIDLGSQYSHLIVRRLRELGVYAELLPPETSAKTLTAYKGIILSGGPQNISESDALHVDKGIFSLGIPILGVCYGMQLIAFEFGSTIERKTHHEYGSVDVSLNQESILFRGLNEIEQTWMSHGDQVANVPEGFSIVGKSKNCPIAAMENSTHNIFALQFHPEVSHTPNGKIVFENFLERIDIPRTWKLDTQWVEKEVERICSQVGDKRALCALSGGVDSTVAAYLMHRAIGKQLTCMYIDTGLMRLGETEEIENVFSQLPDVSFHIIHAEEKFLNCLKNITDPEEKRKRIGETFIRIFEEEAEKLGRFDFLVQGTLYTDAITSGVSVGGKAAKIKSHHNVGGLPENIRFKLIEPLRNLYKDEVRKIAKTLKVPASIANRQPFPGPGLAVRILGEVTREKLELLRRADAIFREEILKSRQATEIQQYFAVLPGIRSVGVQGDARTYGYLTILRAVTTSDFMTADWARIPYEILAQTSTRITNEVSGINRVAYDITSKPPGTVEWE